MRGKWWQLDWFECLQRSDSRPISFTAWFFISGETLYLPKLCSTSEEEGRAEPSLCSNYREKSHHQPPSLCIWTTLYCSPSGRRLLVPQLRAGLSFSMRAKTEGDSRVRGGEWRAWTCIGNTTETPSWVLYLHLPDHWLKSLTQVGFLFYCDHVIFEYDICVIFMLWESIQTAETLDFPSHH